jgi:hypothetical protein
MSEKMMRKDKESCESWIQNCKECLISSFGGCDDE